MDKVLPMSAIEVDGRIQYAQKLLHLIEPYFVGRACLRFSRGRTVIEKILLYVCRMQECSRREEQVEGSVGQLVNVCVQM